MTDEIELKLALPASAHYRFLRHSLLRNAVSRHTQQLVNLYYDTPALDLHRRGVALRLRKQGRTWLQTVKSAGHSAVGLSTRPEWEIPYQGHFDFSGIDADHLRKWLERPRLLNNLSPQFETNFRRIIWRFEPATNPGAIVLLMLDRGWIAAQGQREAISEVEIELVSGDVAELFKLAQDLMDHIPLVPAVLSKAERGYRLIQGTHLTPVKAQPISVHPDCSPPEAFRLIALSCFEQLQGNREGALGSDNPEFIHQMRVATRRLRAALRLFAPVLPADFADAMLPPLRELMARLGSARDLDVVLTEIIAPVMLALPDESRLAALADVVSDHQCAARSAALAYLQSPAFGRMLLQATAALHKPSFVAGAGETSCFLIAPCFAENRLRYLYEKVFALSAQAHMNAPASLHSLRIAIKRLRYALEFFASLLSDKPLRRLLHYLTTLQEELGQLNDLANAGMMLMRCAADDSSLREAVTLVGGWHGPNHAALLARIPPHLKDLKRLKLPSLKS